MKTTTFLMGALAGATLVMLTRRNRMVSAAAGMVGQQMKSRWNGMKEDAIGKMVNRRFGDKDRGRSASDGIHSSDHRIDNSSRFSNHSHEHSSSSGSGLSDVARLATEDPSVKQSINEILEQSGEHRI